ncbi:calcium-binding protein [Ramlibacter sp.]|uniref:calcium-binding protein n=1 Tax=Ramlibacter sp. TaxID=1917967 RepID=UPI002BBA3131|nr:calcium-binding protein [Ramlibacter sp.]HWI81046.1 calcium-binding protein [Ramlibacter sp.]
MEIQGSAADDFLTGTSSADQLRGGAGNDTLLGAAGDDLLEGGPGDDWLQGGSGSDSLDGGAGLGDTADYSDAPGAVGVNLWWNVQTGDAAGDSLTNIEHLTGSAFDDALFGNEFGNSIAGGAGNDTIYGLSGNDTLSGGTGSDWLDGGSGAADFASYADATAAVDADLGIGSATGGAGSDTLVNIEGLIGSAFGDRLNGDDWDNILRGGAGNDTLNGGAGDDVIAGGSGDDAIQGGIGSDTADYSVAGSASGVVVDLVAGAASGGAGSDTLGGIENVVGSGFGDAITGNAGPNFLDGRAGDDLLTGGAGRDSFVGGEGNDSIDGGAILDRVTYSDLNSVSYAASTAGVQIDLAAGIGTDGLGGVDSLANINAVIGSAFGDTLLGSSDATLFELFEGGLGNDSIDGGALDPVLQRNSNQVTYAAAIGAVSVDLAAGTASGAAGADTLLHINQVIGSSFADTLLGSDSAMPELFEGGMGNDTIDGRGGLDLVRYEAAIAGVKVDLAAGTAKDGLAGTDTLLGIEGIQGSRYNDVLAGGNAANGAGALDGLELFTGNAGNDTIDGGAGYDVADYLTSTSGVMVTLGGAGQGSAADGWGGVDVLISIEGVRGSAYNDWLTGSDTGAVETFEGGAGNDTIDGRAGLDIVDYRFAPSGTSVDLEAGTALDGYGARDMLSNIEDVRGSTFADLITGTRTANRIEGGAGDDTIDGGAGFDTAVFSGPQAAYTIVRRGVSVTVTGPDGADTLSNVETLSFSDGDLVLWGPGLHGKGGAAVVGSWPDLLG